MKSQSAVTEAKSRHAVEPIRRRRLHEEIETRLEDEIRTGRLQIGDHIPSERDLMARFDVGRPAIREALLGLKKKGLLRVGPGRRSRVLRPTFDTVVAGVSSTVAHLLSESQGVRDLQQARRFFECALTRHAASRARPADLAKLEAALEANAVAIDDPIGFERTDIEFHFQIATIARNPIFTALHQATIGWLLQQRNVSLQQPGALPAAHRFHKRIFDAIATRDPDRAEKQMERHLQSVERFYWRSSGATARRRS